MSCGDNARLTKIGVIYETADFLQLCYPKIAKLYIKLHPSYTKIQNDIRKFYESLSEQNVEESEKYLEIVRKQFVFHPELVKMNMLFGRLKHKMAKVQ